MQISISPDLSQFVDEQVKAGQYATPADVVEDALQLLRRFPPWTEEQLRREITTGIEQLDRGEGTPWDLKEFLAEVHQQHAERTHTSRDAKNR